MPPSRHDSYNPNGSYDRYEHCQKQQDYREEPLAVQSGHKIPIDQHPDRRQDGDHACDLNEELQVSASAYNFKGRLHFFFLLFSF
jgi:hypothetical protein